MAGIKLFLNQVVLFVAVATAIIVSGATSASADGGYADQPDWNTAWSGCVLSVFDWESNGLHDAGIYNPHVVQARGLVTNFPSFPDASYRYDLGSVSVDVSGTGDGSYFWAAYSDYSAKIPYAVNYYTISGGVCSITPVGPVGPVDFSTHFESFTPLLGTTTPNATSTTFTFGATGYVNSTDFATSSTELYIRWRQMTEVGVGSNDWRANVGEITIPIESPGEFNLSTTTDILDTGVYTVGFFIRKPRFEVLGFGFLNNELRSAIGSFVVGSTTTEKEFQTVELMVGTTGAAFANQQVVTEQTASSSLLSLSTIFDFKDQVLGKFPINWVIEYSNVLQNLASSTSTTTIPSVTINYGSLSLLQNIPTTTPITTTFTFFSADTFDEVGEMSGIQLFREFVSWTLWIALVSYAWRRGQSLFKRQLDTN